MSSYNLFAAGSQPLKRRVRSNSSSNGLEAHNAAGSVRRTSRPMPIYGRALAHTEDEVST